MAYRQKKSSHLLVKRKKTMNTLLRLLVWQTSLVSTWNLSKNWNGPTMLLRNLHPLSDHIQFNKLKRERFWGVFGMSPQFKYQVNKIQNFKFDRLLPISILLTTKPLLNTENEIVCSLQAATDIHPLNNKTFIEYRKWNCVLIIFLLHLWWVK